MALFAEVLAARSVRAAFLVEMQFVSGAMRLWEGYGTITTNDGKEWRGVRGLGRIEGLELAVNGNAPQTTLILSGVAPENQAIEEGDPTSYVNQPVLTFLQFFDGDWAVLDPSIPVWSGTMQTVQESYGWEEEQKAWISTIGIACESWFAIRGRSPASFYSSADQAMRFPGTIDLGLDHVPEMQNYTMRWPDL